MTDVKRYVIGGKTYEQRPLVFGQVRQLTGLLEGVRISPSSGPAEIVAALGGRLSMALAVVLTVEGQSPRGKDLAALADEIEFDISPEEVFRIVEDFFDCNPLASLLEKLTGAIGKIREKLPTGSMPPSVSSPAATSPSGTGYSGDAPPESAASTSNSAAES